MTNARKIVALSTVSRGALMAGASTASVRVRRRTAEEFYAAQAERRFAELLERTGATLDD